MAEGDGYVGLFEEVPRRTLGIKRPKIRSFRRNMAYAKQKVRNAGGRQDIIC